MTIAQSNGAAWTRKHDEPGVPLIPAAQAIVYPQTLEDLITLCSTRERGKRLHAAGSHWALSAAAISDNIFIETNDPNNYFPAMGRTLRDVVPNCMSADALAALDKTSRSIGTDGFSTSSPETTPVYFVHVEAGKRIYQLYAELDITERDAPDNLGAYMKAHFNNDYLPKSSAFSTLGGAGGQTVVGALTTGTHGGDFDRPPIADAVIAMHIVADGGKHYWIEPKRYLESALHFTDEAKLRALYGQKALGGPANFEVIHDDAVFRAALVQVGRFGVVYSVVLGVVAQYGLASQLKQDTWENVKGRIADFRSDLYVNPQGKQRFLQIVVDPIATANGSSHICGITRRWTISMAAIGFENPLGRAERVGQVVKPVDARLNAPLFEQAGASVGYTKDGDGTPNFLDMACADPSFADGIVSAIYTEIENFIKDHTLETGGALAAVAAVGGAAALEALIPALIAILAILALFLEAIRHSGPKRLGQALNGLRGSLLNNPDPIARAAGILVWRAIASAIFKSEQKEESFNAISYAMMDTHTYTDVSCQVNVHSCEVFFDAADPNLIAFVDRLLQYESDQEFAAGKSLAGYISLRFVAESSALIAPAKFGRTCAVECSALVDVDGSSEFVAYATRLGLDPNIRGILHWGQQNTCTQFDTELRFGDSPGNPSGPLHEWRAVLSRLTDNGRLDGFSSSFTRAAGLEVVQPLVGDFAVVGKTAAPTTSFTLSWQCLANPPGTTITIEIVPASGEHQLLGALPLSGQHELVNIAPTIYDATLTAALTTNGATRKATRTVRFESGPPPVIVR